MTQLCLPPAPSAALPKLEYDFWLTNVFIKRRSTSTRGAACAVIHDRRGNSLMVIIRWDPAPEPMNPRLVLRHLFNAGTGEMIARFGQPKKRRK